MFNCIETKPQRYGSYEFPAWADGLGWMLTLASVMAIPIGALYQVCTADKELTILEVLCHLLYFININDPCEKGFDTAKVQNIVFSDWF